MNDDQKGPAVVPETTYLPPPTARPQIAGDDQPADTMARSAESTLADRAPDAPPQDESQIATLDSPSAPADESATAVTIDQSRPASAPQARSASRLAPQQIGDYDVLGELGRGGMGVVYKARHRQLGRVVALKMIRTGAHADLNEVSRFLTEAQAVARLQHAGIVQIFDIGQHDGLPYFSLELVEGGCLTARVAKEPLEPREAAQLVEQLAQAMQYAHERGILHRDLKPANVLLAEGGQPKITDFGLAKQLESLDSSATQTGAILGTPSYMSPEQGRGDVRELTSATDQYSLGAILYHLLTGRPPFLAPKAVETVLQVIHDEPVPPRNLVPKLPVDLETICLKALHKDPQRRYASCAELAADLRRFLAGEPIVARPVSPVERAWRWCRRNPRVAIPTAASVLLFLIAFGISVAAAWSLSTLNARLKTETKRAQTNEQIAKEKAKEATVAQGKEKGARELADQRTEASLSMAKRVISTFSENVHLAPGLRPLMTEIAQESVRDLEKMPGASQAGITEPATRLAYHQLMYDLQREMGKTEEAWTHVTAAHKIARQRIIDQRGSLDSKQNLAVICLDMARIRQEYDRDMDASLAYAMEGIQLCEEILRQPFGTAEKQISIRLVLAQLYSFVGATHVRLGVPAKALEYFEKSRAADEQTLKEPAFERLQENSRKVTEARIRAGSATSLLAIGDMHFRLGNPDKAKENYKQALALREEIFQASPNLSQSKYYVAAYCSQSGYLHFVLGEVEVARPLYERAVKLATELAAVNRNSVDYFRALALAHYRFGVFKKSLNDPTATEHFETCLKIRTSLAKDAANVSRQRELLLAQARAGKHAEAAALAEQLLAQVKPPDVELLLDLARAYAQCGVAAASDEAAAEVLRAKAIAALKQAVDQGHQDRVYLETEPDYVPLHELSEFQKLIDREREAAKGDH